MTLKLFRVVHAGDVIGGVGNAAPKAINVRS